MANTVIVGSQWGDEGKAKVIDFLTRQADIVARFQGGANAGHTVVVGTHKYVFHLVPSGIIYPGKACVIGNGVVFDAEQFLIEVDELEQRGIRTGGRLFVSDQAHLVLPYHKAQDRASESAKGGKSIGTTGRGIGPAYADKSSRRGIRVGELRNWDSFVIRVREAVERKRALITAYYHADFTVNADEITEQYRGIRERLLPMLTDTSRMLYEAVKGGKSVLYEGAQGTFLDIDHGTYPFVTSSNTVAGSVCTGLGVGPSMVDHVVGIVKAYTTRVGNGPFPTELNDAIGERLRAEGGEFGATTGRPRRCGWFDSVLLRKAVELNGMTRMALTKLDVLNGFEEIKICTKYRIDGKETEHCPTDPLAFAKAEPIYETMPGWNCDLSGARSVSELPQNAQRYIARLQQLCHDVPLLMVSMGPERSQSIEVNPV